MERSETKLDQYLYNRFAAVWILLSILSFIRDKEYSAFICKMPNERKRAASTKVDEISKKKHFRISPASLQIAMPMRMILSGSSGAGKSYFIKRLLDTRHYMFQYPITPPILYFFNTMNDTVAEIGQKDGVVLKKGFSLDQVNGYEQKSGNHELIIVDDYMNSKYYKELSILFANKSRHRNISVALLTQNSYSQVEF